MALPAFLIPILMQMASQAMSKGLESKPNGEQKSTSAPAIQTGVEKPSSLSPMHMGLLKGLGFGE